MIDSTGMPQTAVVLGGTSDIARCILRLLVARRLSKIVLAGRDFEALSGAGKELEALGAQEVSAVRWDATDIASHQDLVEESARRLGQVDMVLVAAGMLGNQASDESDPEAVARVITTNFTGPAAAMVGFAGLLRRQGSGRLVVLSSVAGVRVRRANYVYGSSKAGLDCFAQGMADALEGTGASVVIVRPGWVATSMTAGLKPGPMATTPEAVATDVIAGLEKGSSVIWSPAPLKVVFGIFRLAPRALWRRLPG